MEYDLVKRQNFEISDLVGSTLSIIILDSSGSMQRFKDITQSAVNDHLKNCQNPPDGRKQYCSVITFDTHPRVAIPLTPAENISAMTEYKPNGNTLLWKTVDDVLRQMVDMYKKLSNHQKKNIAVVIGVFSDGEDNQSDRDIYPQRLRSTVELARTHGFYLLATGIGIDGKRLALEMGFPEDLALTVKASAQGIQDASHVFTTCTTTLGYAPPSRDVFDSIIDAHDTDEDPPKNNF